MTKRLVADQVGIKTRRHSNNFGRRTVRTGSTYHQMKSIARKLNIPFKGGDVRGEEDCDGRLDQD